MTTNPQSLEATHRETPVSGRALLKEVLRGDGDLGWRMQQLRSLSRAVRSSEYHITNACNLRCRGCWFFEYGYDRASREMLSLDDWSEFVRRQSQQNNVSAALLIGGEPTLHLDRIRIFVEHMPFVTISSNGLRPLPKQGFENVAVALTVFGGGPLDDSLRAVRPGGQRFTGLFETALDHYRQDPRATFIYALSLEGVDFVEETVRRVSENGNLLTFNYYSDYGSSTPLRREGESRLLEEALRVKALYPQTVICDDYYIRTLITGRSHWDEFGYAVCPSISIDHPQHAERIVNGNPVLPGFNSWAPDGKTLNFCCTSGHCEGCRDSQAVYSWLLTNMNRFLSSKEELASWMSIAESYWAQFVWSPYHPAAHATASPVP